MVPGWEVSAAPQETGSSVTSPLDQVTATVSGSSGAPPTQTSWAGTASADTIAAASTLICALAATPVSPTTPLSVNAAPPRLESAASCSPGSALHAMGSSVILPSDQLTEAVAGNAAKSASAFISPLAISSSTSCPSTLATSSGLTVTCAVTGLERPSIVPVAVSVPATEVSSSSQATGSSLTSPLDQVTVRVSGSSGVPPTQISWAEGISAYTGTAGRTVTFTVTSSPRVSTVPATSNEPPSRLFSMASCASVRGSHVTGSSVVAPPVHRTLIVWGSSSVSPLGTIEMMVPLSPRAVGTATTSTSALATTSPAITTCNVAGPDTNPPKARSLPPAISPTTLPSWTTCTVACSNSSVGSMATPAARPTALPVSVVEALMPSSTGSPTVRVSGATSSKISLSFCTFTPW